MKKEITWIVLADSHELRIFEDIRGQKADPALIHHLEFETVPNEKKGRTFNSIGPVRHAMEPHTDPRDVERDHFAREITAILEEALNNHRFDHITLVAPHKMFDALNHHLSKQIQQKINHKLHKNITDIHPHNLREYLQEAISD